MRRLAAHRSTRAARAAKAKAKREGRTFHESSRNGSHAARLVVRNKPKRI